MPKLKEHLEQLRTQLQQDAGAVQLCKQLKPTIESIDKSVSHSTSSQALI